MRTWPPSAHFGLEKMASKSCVHHHCGAIGQVNSQQPTSVCSIFRGSRKVWVLFFVFFVFFLPLPRSFRRPWCRKRGTEQVIKNDKSVFQENIHFAAGTECPCQEPPCRASLNTWQTFPSNLCNLRKGNISSKSSLSNSFIGSFQRQSREMLLELIQEIFMFLKKSSIPG